MSDGGGIDLPMLPAAAQQVLSLCQAPDIDASRLAAVIHRDPSLAGHVLRIANSPVYQRGVEILSLQQAISRLGLRALSELAVAVAVRSKLFEAKGYKTWMVSLWRHSVATGLFAKEVARQGRRNVESAFLCGLLHDVGKPVILGAVLEHPDLVRDVASAALAGAVESYHGGIGVCLAEHWSLPDAVRASIEHHHDYAAAGAFTDTVAMVHLADLLAYTATPGRGPQVDDAGIRALPVLETLNLYPDDVEALLATREAVLARLEVLA